MAEDVDYVPDNSGATFSYDTWYAVVLSFLFWVLMYFAVKFKVPDRSPEYCSRVVTLCHGGLMGFYGLDQCFKSTSIFDDPNEKTTRDQAFILAVSLGYFLLDLCWCLYYQTETTLILAHHTYSCFALSRMLFKGNGGHAASCGLGALEITNPLLQARWFSRTYGYHNTALFTSIELTFMVMFFSIRIILGTLYIIYIAIEPATTWEFRFLTLLIYIMSWMFTINIFKYFTNKYLKDTVVEGDLPRINTS